jgi:hypothetical protein
VGTSTAIAANLFAEGRELIQGGRAPGVAGLKAGATPADIETMEHILELMKH